VTTHPIPRLFVTGATGELGQLVIDALLRTVPADRIVAGVRNPDAPAAAALGARGVEVRTTDYTKPETLTFEDIGKLLLISSNAIGARVAQHRNVIDAAARAGVGLIAYTSVLHAATSPLGLAEEHRQTEATLAAAGVPFVVLRNGWYTENYTAAVPAALAHGALLGSAGAGRISSAARADYAAAAAAVLTSDIDQNGKIYELAGDASAARCRPARAARRPARRFRRPCRRRRAVRRWPPAQPADRSPDDPVRRHHRRRLEGLTMAPHLAELRVFRTG